MRVFTVRSELVNGVVKIRPPGHDLDVASSAWAALCKTHCMRQPLWHWNWWRWNIMLYFRIISLTDTHAVLA